MDTVTAIANTLLDSYLILHFLYGTLPLLGSMFRGVGLRNENWFFVIPASPYSGCSAK